MKNKSIIWQSIVIAVGVVVLIALCFFVWKSPEVYSQGMAIVISAALGAILTAIITRMVIGSQLQSEQEKEKNIKIYEMKMRVYSEFISKMWPLYEDGKIDEKELLVLRKEIFNKLIFLLKESDIDNLITVIEKLRKEIIADSQEYIIARRLAIITWILRGELNLSDTTLDFDDNNTMPIVKLWDAFSDRLEQEEEKPEEKPIDSPNNTSVSVQTDRQYWHMNMVDRAMQQKALKDGKYELALIEYGEDKRTNILKQVNKGDLIFLYNKGNMFLGIFEAIGRRIFYYEDQTLKEDIVEDLSCPNNINTITEEKQLKEHLDNYDVYRGIEDGADICANLIVKPLACMLMRKNDDIAAYRPTICTYWKTYGDDIMIKYYEALNDSKFGKIDDIVIDCDVETFKSLFKLK